MYWNDNLAIPYSKPEQKEGFLVMYPVLISIGFIKIYSYGIFIAIAFIVALRWLKRKADKEGIEPSTLMDLGLYILISAIIGSRALYVIYNYQYYLRHPLEIILLTKGGLIFYGGLILALLTGIIFINRRKLHFWRCVDLIAPSLALGQSIGRIGCFLSGCCYGKPTKLFWGVKFPSESLAATHYGSSYLHPTQLYISLVSIGIFAYLNYKLKNRQFLGEVFTLYLILYSIFRFLIEFVRGDNPLFLFSLTISQVISIFLFLMGVFLWYRLKRERLIS
jgi:phosphatidylglycerol:prolipoprotein diacylglycerol transferase